MREERKTRALKTRVYAVHCDFSWCTWSYQNESEGLARLAKTNHWLEVHDQEPVRYDPHL